MPIDPRLNALLTTPVNDVLLDRAIRHAVFLERYKTGQVNRILGFLNQDVFPEVSRLVSARLGRIAARGFDTGLNTTQRLRDLEQALAGQIATAARTATSMLASELRPFALTEAQWQARTMGNATKDFLTYDFTIPNVRTLNSIVSTRPMQGALMRDWFKDLGNGTRTNIRRAINQGIAIGETNEQVVRRLVGTRAQGFTDGVFQTTRHNARTIVRTSVNHVSTHAREETYRDNEEVVKGVQIVATLDDRTTFICISLDGKVYMVNEGDRPPFHPQCRSTTVPVLKSWKELGINLKEAPANTRAALNGQVPAETTYPQWFNQQPPAFQREVLGPSRYELFRSGRVELTRFADRTGRTLSLDELRKLEGMRSLRTPRKQATPRPPNTPKPPPVAPKPANASGKEVREGVLKDASAKVGAVEAQEKAIASIIERYNAAVRSPEFATYADRISALNGIKAELEKAKAAAEAARAVVRQAALKHLRVSNPVDFQWVNPTGLNRIRDKAFKANAAEAREFVSQVLSKDALDKLNVDIAKTRAGGRAHATPGKVHIPSNDPTRTWVHEIGHNIEFASDELRNRTNAFLWARAAEDPRGLRRLSRITGNRAYGAQEIAWEDKFIDPYIGKDYRRGVVERVPTVKPGVLGPPTEVLSMGIEMLYADPVGFARKDPAMFDFIVDLLRGAP